MLILQTISSEGTDGMESDNASSSAEKDFPNRSGSADAPTRFVEIDSLKATGIIAYI